MTYLRVMSERVMIRGIEGPLKRLMDKVSWCLRVWCEGNAFPIQTSSSYLQVEGRVRRQPGLLSYKTLVDIENPNNYCVLTKWKSEVRLLFESSLSLFSC